MGLYIRIVIGLAIAAMIGWVVRVDSLRGHYKAQLTEAVITIKRLTGRDVGFGKISATIIDIHTEGQRFKRERDNARDVLEVQTESIRRYEAETKRLRQISAEQAALAARLIADRDKWIAKAKSAATRTERRSAEQELGECESVLDALYAAGF
jgi:hypothetical protein